MPKSNRREMHVQETNDAASGRCVLCQRHVPLTFHHLIPRKLHRRTRFRRDFAREVLAAGIAICRLCHDGIHDLYDETTLGLRFNTLEALLADEPVMRHVAWAARQRATI